MDKTLSRKTATPSPSPLRWLDAFDRRLTLRGLAWAKENAPRFNRLPLRAKGIVREPVWELARCPAGARLCFRSNTTRLAVRVQLAALPQFPHFPLTGSAGLSLYIGEPYRSALWAIAVPDPSVPSYERELASGLPRTMHEFTLYLPLYAALEKLEVGVDAASRFEAPSPPALPRPVVFYGTSITQGGCASAAGFDFVASVARRLNLDFVNLGFSGNGKGEPEMARLISEIHAAAFVLDYVANVNLHQLRKTLPRFHSILRQAHPETPIILLSRVEFARTHALASSRTAHEDFRDAVIHFYSRTRRAGDRNVHFVDGSALLPYAADAAQVDGAHPADYGFALMAERFAPFLRAIVLDRW